VVSFAYLEGRPISPANVVLAGTFLNDYRILFHLPGSPTDYGVFLVHTWSLATEEQFYLLWPAALVLVGLQRAKRLAIVLILLMPFVRTASYFLFPSLRPSMVFEAHDNVDRIMCGCLLALLSGNVNFESAMARLRSVLWPMACFAYILLVEPVLEFRFGGLYTMPIGVSLESLMWAFVLAWLLRNPDSMAAGWFNLKPVVIVGTLSYSLYLWQQPFTQAANSSMTGRFPFNLICIAVAACFSYVVVERPFNELRDRFRR
jgi:peptidoglycan/LPS O-acetylase OafA/YrhL